MFKLQPTEDIWLEIVPARDGAPAAELLVAPIGRLAVRKAREAVAAILRVDDAELGAAADALSYELLRLGIRDWRGIGNAAGEPIPCTPENIELFLNDPDAFDAADRAYVLPWSLRDAEKNASPGAPNGISAAATPGNVTASSAAKRKRKAAAKPAPTAPTKSRQRPAKPSGR